MSTPALTEFLTARADGLEILARDMQHQAALGRPLVTLNGGGDLLRALVDPARVLAQVKAMRAIVEMHHVNEKRLDHVPDEPECYVCSYEIRDDGSDVGFPCLTVRILASIFADHPDYDPAWRVDA